MDQPTSKRSKTTLPNHLIGLNSDKLDESNINSAAWRFTSMMKEAPVGTGNVGKCQTMRQRILQLSLFPDIYDKVKRVKHPGNVDFGNKEDSS